MIQQSNTGQTGHQLAQIFLPYHNLLHDVASTPGPVTLRGWQFGLPPVNDEADMYVVILGDNGGVYQSLHPGVRNPPHGPPTPLWAWVRTEAGTARITEPERRPGSLPLSDLNGSGEEDITFYTPSGARAHDQRLQREDVQTDLAVPEGLGPKGALELGPHTLAHLTAANDRVLTITPTPRALEIGLWTSHLARVIDVRSRL